MNSDCAFEIGEDHRICQDYAIHGADKDTHYVIVADGCTSSPDTDIGARFIVKAAETFIYQIQISQAALPSLERYHQQSIQFAQLSSKVLKLDQACLDATMLTIKANRDGFVASCYGDGVVALARRDGKLEIYSIDFTNGFPQYVSYTLNALKRKEYETYRDNQKTVTKRMVPDMTGAAQVTQSANAIEFYFGSRIEYHFAAVLSDGVHSFVEVSDYESLDVVHRVPMVDIVPHLLMFRGSTGDFVQRRMRSFANLCAARRWIHTDDLSVGVVSFE